MHEPFHANVNADVNTSVNSISRYPQPPRDPTLQSPIAPRVSGTIMIHVTMTSMSDHSGLVFRYEFAYGEKIVTPI